MMPDMEFRDGDSTILPFLSLKTARNDRPAHECNYKTMLESVSILAV